MESIESNDKSIDDTINNNDEYPNNTIAIWCTGLITNLLKMVDMDPK